MTTQLPKSCAELFAGIGGISYGLQAAGVKPTVICEIKKHLHPVLKREHPEAIIIEDIKHLSIESVPELKDVYIICGGFPCQDISQAGKGAGLNGTRSGLWWEMRRIISESRPTWVLAENVPALRTRGGDDVLASLEKLGYTCWSLVVGARHVGAPHQRDRIWIVGYRNSLSIRQQSSTLEREYPLVETEPCCQEPGSTSTELAYSNSNPIRQQSNTQNGDGQTIPGNFSETMANSNSNGCQGNKEVPDTNKHDPQGRSQCTETTKLSRNNLETFQLSQNQTGITKQFPSGPSEPQQSWEAPRTIESFVGTPTHGLSRKLALEAIGNAVVPQVVESIGKTMMWLDELLQPGDK